MLKCQVSTAFMPRKHRSLRRLRDAETPCIFHVYAALKCLAILHLRTAEIITRVSKCWRHLLSSLARIGGPRSALLEAHVEFFNNMTQFQFINDNPRNDASKVTQNLSLKWRPCCRNWFSSDINLRRIQSSEVGSTWKPTKFSWQIRVLPAIFYLVANWIKTWL